MDDIETVNCELCGKQFETDDPAHKLCRECMKKTTYIRKEEYVLKESNG